MKKIKMYEILNANYVFDADVIDGVIISVSNSNYKSLIGEDIPNNSNIIFGRYVVVN